MSAIKNPKDYKETYYNKDYFLYQNKIGLLSARANKFLFLPFISPNDNVVDFGSGGGYYLSLINCKEKIGVEINEAAREVSTQRGVNTVKSPELLQDNWADIIYSSHALEHCHNPLEILKSLKPKLKINGKIIFVVPSEKKVKYKPTDMNQHLFTWSEMNLGNLFTLAGYKVEKVEEISHRFPPFSNKLMNTFGERVFHILAKAYAIIKDDVSQVRVIATRTS